MPPPPDGQWARTETVDSSIVRFLLPIGGAALLKLPWRLHFHINRHVLMDTAKYEDSVIPAPDRWLFLIVLIRKINPPPGLDQGKIKITDGEGNLPGKTVGTEGKKAPVNVGVQGGHLTGKI